MEILRAEELQKKEKARRERIEMEKVKILEARRQKEVAREKR